MLPRFFCGSVVLFDPGPVRSICRDLAVETNPERVQDLMSLLQAVIRDDQEEVWLRLLCLAEKYAPVLKDEETRKALEALKGKPQPFPKCE
jgi:hypothetical protein